MNDQDGLELDKECKYCKNKSQGRFLTEVIETESSKSDPKSPKVDQNFDIDTYDISLEEEEKKSAVDLKYRQ